MRRETHFVVGAATGFLLAPSTEYGWMIAVAAGAMVASLPDTIERPLHLEHRKASHSIFAVVIIYGLTSVLFPLPYNFIITASYAAHILSDALTISGVYWLAPLRRYRLWLLPKPIRPRTGGRIDALLGACAGIWLLWQVAPLVIDDLNHVLGQSVRLMELF